MSTCGGRPFTFFTDHQALTTLLSSQGTGHRPLKIARWAARLLNYNFVVRYKKGEDNVIADALSRLPLPTVSPDTLDEEIIYCINPQPISKAEMQTATSADPVLQKVLHFVATTWPSKVKLGTDFFRYYQVRSELSEVDGLFLNGERIVVPPTLTDHQLGT